MRSFLLVTGLFLAINTVAAGTMLFVGQGAKALFPEYTDSYVLWLLVGISGIAVALAGAWWAIGPTRR